MLDKESARLLLGPNVVGATFTNDAGTFTLPEDHVLLEVYSDGYQACAIDAFLAMFADVVPDEFSREEAFAALIAADADGALGWRKHFERWRGN